MVEELISKMEVAIAKNNKKTSITRSKYFSPQ
jgi:hypothetical protein